MGRRVWIVGLILLLALAAAALLWRGLTRSGLPQREGNATLPGIASTVTVRWNDRGVPHVTAGRAVDLAEALGWIHANDRFTQMELGRRLGAGRLAELVGDAALPSDRYFVSMGFRQIAREQEAALGDESRAWLAAYARGVNAWVEQRDGDLPPELSILGSTPEPWSIRDSIYFQLQLSHDLSFWQARPEEPRLRWLGAIGPERLRDLLGDPDLHVPAETLEIARAAPDRRNDVPAEASPGSNNWALGPSRTGSGNPLVANDPHLALALPGVWYQVQLRSPDYEAAGMTLPGLPFVVLGQGPRVAWAFTNVMLDDHDLFLERLDDTGAAVRRGERWVEVREEVEAIVHADGTTEAITLRWTDHGLLLPADPSTGMPARSLRWSASLPSDAAAVFRLLARADGVPELAGRLDAMIAPAQNLVAADAAGNLLHQPIGRVPDRRLGDGRLPSPGWDPAYGWQGMLPQATNPQRLNPDDGLLVTANHDIRPETAPPTPLTADFDTPYRADRIRQILERRSDWTLPEMDAVQTDVRSLYALDLVSRLSTDHEGTAARAAAALRGWDGEMVAGGPAALFAILERELIGRIFGDDAAHLGLPSIAGRAQLIRILAGDLDPIWFDDPATPVGEGRREIVEAALEAAWDRTLERFGEAPAGWDYPALNLLTLDHPLAALPVLGTRWGRGPLPMPGSATTVAAFGGRWVDDRIDVVYGPSMRWVADPTDPDASRVTLPAGQSGHPWDRHYDDQLEDYLAGRLRPALWSDAAIEGGTVSRLMFRSAERN